MISVTLVGSGNVAHHLGDIFLASEGIEFKQLYTRNTQDLTFWKHRVATTNSLNLLEESDVTILAISDDSIKAVSKHIQSPLVVHTSGGRALSELQNNTKKGIFYPLQTFSKNSAVNWSEIPICIEAENGQDYEILNALAQAMGTNAHKINSAQRQYLHIAAVFANNFSNHMFYQAHLICDQQGIDFEILQPLIRETVQKLGSLMPIDAQTGPAKRNDIETIKKHVALLSEEQKKLYLEITESIRRHG